MAIFAVTFLSIVTKLLVAVNVLVCFMLIFVVLLQRPKNEGLGAAFGGDTASNIFGAQTTNVLVNLTRWLAGIFMVVTLALSLLYSRNDESRTATSAFIEKARKDKEADEARKKNEAAAKEAADAKTGVPPVTTSDPLKAPVEGGAPGIEAQKDIEKQIKDAIEGASKPAAPTTPVPNPVPSPEPTKAPEAPKPAEPVKPADAPTPAPEPAKPADAPEPAKPN